MIIFTFPSFPYIDICSAFYFTSAINKSFINIVTTKTIKMPCRFYTVYEKVVLNFKITDKNKNDI